MLLGYILGKSLQDWDNYNNCSSYVVYREESQRKEHSERPWLHNTRRKTQNFLWEQQNILKYILNINKIKKYK